MVCWRPPNLIGGWNEHFLLLEFDGRRNITLSGMQRSNTLTKALVVVTLE